MTETTALGAAYLAGLAAGVYQSLDEIGSQWRCEQRFNSRMTEVDRERRYRGWQNAVRKVRAQ